MVMFKYTLANRVTEKGSLWAGWRLSVCDAERTEGALLLRTVSSPSGHEEESSVQSSSANASTLLSLLPAQATAFECEREREKEGERERRRERGRLYF